MDGEGHDVDAVGLRSFAEAGGVHAEEHDLEYPMRPQRFGNIRHERSDLTPELLGPRPELLRQMVKQLRLLFDGRDEGHVVTTRDLALLQKRQHVALDPATEIPRLELCNQKSSPVVDVAQAVLEDRGDQLFLGAEVVLHRRVVAASGRRADLAQGDAFVAALSEEPLRSQEYLLLGRRSNCRRHRHPQHTCRLEPITSWMRTGLYG